MPPDDSVASALPPQDAVRLSVEEVSQLDRRDLTDLCDATDAAIAAGGGFGWVDVPEREVLERYWKGVLIVPERHLFVGRVDGTIAGSAQMLRPPPNNQAQRFAVTVTTSFVAPWAQGQGLARLILEQLLVCATDLGFDVVNLDVRETQERAIHLYESMGFRRWGEHPWYARVGDRTIRGYYFTRLLRPIRDAAPTDPTEGSLEP